MDLREQAGPESTADSRPSSRLDDPALVGLPAFPLDVSSLSLAGSVSSQSQPMSLGSSSFSDSSSVLFSNQPPSTKPSHTQPTTTDHSIKENTGRWTSEEHNIFLEGLKLHGKGWKAIAQMIKTRTVVQIRTHAQKYFQKLAKAQQNGECPEEVIMDTRSQTTSSPIDIPRTGSRPSFPNPTSSSSSAPKRKKKGAPSKRKPQQAGLDATAVPRRQVAGSAPKRLAIETSHFGGAGSPSPSSIMDVNMSHTFSDEHDWLPRVQNPDVDMELLTGSVDALEWFPSSMRMLESASSSDISSMSDYNSESEKEDRHFVFPSDTSLFTSDPQPFAISEMEPTFDLGVGQSVFDPALDEDAFVSALLADADGAGVWNGV